MLLCLSLPKCCSWLYQGYGLAFTFRSRDVPTWHILGIFLNIHVFFHNIFQRLVSEMRLARPRSSVLSRHIFKCLGVSADGRHHLDLGCCYKQSIQNINLNVPLVVNQWKWKQSSLHNCKVNYLFRDVYYWQTLLQTEFHQSTWKHHDLSVDFQWPRPDIELHFCIPLPVFDILQTKVETECEMMRAMQESLCQLSFYEMVPDQHNS